MCLEYTKAGTKCSRKGVINGRCKQHASKVESNMCLSQDKHVVTITFSEVVENHVGMQKVGTIANEGFTLDTLEQAKSLFEQSGFEAEVIRLDQYYDQEEEVTEAGILIVRNGVDALIGPQKADQLLQEHLSLEWDTKARMRGKVVNKHARYNLCYDDFAQEPDYENNKGRIIRFDDIPLTNEIRQRLPDFLGEQAEKLKAEGNLYFDTSKCGIGFHGDGERKRVVAIRLGQTMPLHYQWYFRGEPVGERIEFQLNHGDLYVMSEKATGFDWKRRVIPTLRHAAGCDKYLTIKPKRHN